MEVRRKREEAEFKEKLARVEELQKTLESGTGDDVLEKKHLIDNTIAEFQEKEKELQAEEDREEPLQKKEVMEIMGVAVESEEVTKQLMKLVGYLLKKSVYPGAPPQNRKAVRAPLGHSEEKMNATMISERPAPLSAS